jgi:[ribosomal protein S18]-alanine N-acetyltransferase
MHVSIRRTGVDDLEHIKWGLYTALSWNPDRELPPVDVTLEHPEAARYHTATGAGRAISALSRRPTVASSGSRTAACSPTTTTATGTSMTTRPEVAVAVDEEYRGRGLGERLMNGLATAAREAGFRWLSLSVGSENPARRLYERLGYREISVDEGGVRMVTGLDGE